ncbi:MAG: phosphotriesterase-related protein [Chloroflexota bacterium]|nr:phosphotriesterase-related protein [Chloroflexota bacterium]
MEKTETGRDGADGDRRAVGVGSGQVMTVLGAVPVADLGLTLMHEHVFIDAAQWWREPLEATRKHLAHQQIRIDILGELRLDPFVNRDNCRLLDPDAAVEELSQFRALGGQTVVDPTNVGIGRDPLALQQVSRRTGLQIVMGCGYYLEGSHPPAVRALSVADVADEIVRDVTDGVPGTNVRAGIIGEIGVGATFTPDEQKVLRGAARAASRTRVPLTIHLPGWERLGHHVLDVVEEESADLAHTVLDHMNPSLHDLDYQTSLADRGAFLEYDMIGMDYFYADQQAQSPSDEENAAALKRLIDAGYGDRLLLSQDVFLKMMLTRHGGWGYAYILRHFVPRLRRHGVSDDQINFLLFDNPRRVFSASRDIAHPAASG